MMKLITEGLQAKKDVKALSQEIAQTTQRCLDGIKSNGVILDCLCEKLNKKK